MVHARLAVIDLETGDQPLYEPGGAALIANAEIYNYIELYDELADAKLTTKSDCEPALLLYRRLGPEFVYRLRGMYAIAIHDPAADQLVLARDPFGIKPLYYTETGQAFAFASEPEALIAAGLASRRLRTASGTELLQLQFTTGADTIYEDIRRVLPGETLVIAGGQVVRRFRQSALPAGAPEEMDEAEAMARLDAAITDSVLVHQRSDVPYGMFLSGGVDSSALIALMAKLNDHPVRAFTVGFPETGVADERDHARTVAKAVGAEHVEIEFGEADFWSLLPRVANVIDDPAIDYAVLPTYKLAAEAASDLKVILTGEGGDELLAGYGRYRGAVRPWWKGGRVPRGRGLFDRLGVLRDSSTSWRDGITAAEVRENLPGRTRLQVVQAVDCADWLPGDLLTKLDRCLMAHGLEGRTPFLDPRVAEVAFRLPDRLKINRRLGKWLLRRWLDQALPAAVPFARKRGFTVPVGEWIAARSRSLGELVATQPGVVEICQPNTVTRLFQAEGKHHRLAAWLLLFYALWHRAHGLGLEPQGDAFDTLSAGS